MGSSEPSVPHGHEPLDPDCAVCAEIIAAEYVPEDDARFRVVIESDGEVVEATAPMGCGSAGSYSSVAADADETLDVHVERWTGDGWQRLTPEPCHKQASS